MIIWILLRFCYWDSVTILTLVIFLDIGILHLKEIEFVPSFSTLNHHLIIFGEDDDDDGDDGDDDDDDALRRVGIEFSRKVPKFEWPAGQTQSVALSHLLKSLPQGLLFNSGGELNYTSEDQSKCKMANAVKESGQISNTSKINCSV